MGLLRPKIKRQITLGQVYALEHMHCNSVLCMCMYMYLGPLYALCFNTTPTHHSPLPHPTDALTSPPPTKSQF